MDRIKTGGLIAQSRKEKNMTQKDLAEVLHVSDRAVSKWERGAGFPDVSLLEPLATALDLNVLDLLRGERREETDVQLAVQETLTAMQEKRRRYRREIRNSLLYILAALLPLILFWMYIRPWSTEVNRTVTAGVYHEGALIDYTVVEMEGDIEHYLLTGRRGYWGRFAIECVPWTTREQTNTGINLHGDEYAGFGYAMPGMLTRELYDTHTYVNRDLTEFAFGLTRYDDPRGWYILASSPTAYEAYCAKYGANMRPPELVSPKPEVLPKFQAPW